ncbi:MAG: ATP-binding cassette domain-containing protein [Anaerolineales bacterium]|nr:ATP-binding cassette domain-containing protein [Anaerolineales bacterium]MCS7249038.1 ATP-binding cassette domain-containing protein [Anaerolineales bacterium]MDW8162851.1 ATP-binding cassette domain-containing protein [Anaerolineales bacterium]MDW8446639.1 ATP-binding cassette domain-containing protein [Anaerolineales bacterium]
MLRAERISFRYSPNRPWILRGFSLAIAPGERVGLYGPSGCGKTTFGRILAGYLQPLGGNVELDGEPLPKKSYCPVQMIFQHPELAINPRWTIGKALYEAYQPPPSLLEALSLDPHWFERFPHELSNGELQRIAVARVLDPRTRYLIADEITTMLDANTQAQLWQVLLDVAAQRRLGMLVISHDRPLLERVCTRIVDWALEAH